MVQAEYEKLIVGDKGSLGKRWELWLERFELALVVNELDDTNNKEKVNALFKLYMGEEMYEAYKEIKEKLKKDSGDKDKREQMVKLLTERAVS